jgi:hypothetical protein
LRRRPDDIGAVDVLFWGGKAALFIFGAMKDSNLVRVSIRKGAGTRRITRQSASENKRHGVGPCRRNPLLIEKLISVGSHQ